MMLRLILTLTLLVVFGWGLPSRAEAQGGCSTYKTYITGDSFGPSDVNSIQVLLGQTNMIAACLDDMSATSSAMQETRNPFPSGSISLATNFKEEITGLRYVIQALTGWDQWYEHTDSIRRAQTWNAAGTNFCAFCVAITDTASHANSRLMELALVSGGADVPKFSVDKSGNVTASGGATFAGPLSATTATLGALTAASGAFSGAVSGTTGDFSGAVTMGSPLGTQYGGLGGNHSATAQGNILYFSAAGTLSALAPGTSGHFLKTQGAGANPIWAAASAGAKTGVFTRDVSTASGNQAVTGVGFQPTSVIFIANLGGSVQSFSWGVDDGSNPEVLSNDATTATQFTAGGSTSESIRLIVSGGNNYQGHVGSFDSDGFTIAWTKNGTPTGTASILYIAFR